MHTPASAAASPYSMMRMRRSRLRQRPAVTSALSNLALAGETFMLQGLCRPCQHAPWIACSYKLMSVQS